MAGLLDANRQPAPAPTAMAPQAEQQAPQGQGPSASAGAGAETLNDPVLKQIEQGIEDSVPPELKEKYQTIVVAGMNVLFSKETSQLMDQQLDASDDVVANVSEGIAKLMVILYNESKQQMDIPAGMLAAITLMCQGLEYWEQAKGGEVTPELAAECTKATTMATLKKFGITEDQVSQVIAAGQQQQGAAAPTGAPAAAQPQMGGM